MLDPTESIEFNHRPITTLTNYMRLEARHPYWQASQASALIYTAFFSAFVFRLAGNAQCLYLHPLPMQGNIVSIINGRLTRQAAMSRVRDNNAETEEHDT